MHHYGILNVFVLSVMCRKKILTRDKMKSKFCLNFKVSLFNLSMLGGRCVPAIMVSYCWGGGGGGEVGVKSIGNNQMYYTQHLALLL